MTAHMTEYSRVAGVPNAEITDNSRLPEVPTIEMALPEQYVSEYPG